jgi:hypothetical protein
MGILRILTRSNENLNERVKLKKIKIKDEFTKLRVFEVYMGNYKSNYNLKGLNKVCLLYAMFYVYKIYDKHNLK